MLWGCGRSCTRLSADRQATTHTVTVNLAQAWGILLLSFMACERSMAEVSWGSPFLLTAAFKAGLKALPWYCGKAIGAHICRCAPARLGSRSGNALPVQYSTVEICSPVRRTEWLIYHPCLQRSCGA